MQPSDEFITSLLSLNCLTKEQSHLIQRQRSYREKNLELLYFIKSFDGAKCSNVIKCLRQTKQKTAARIIEDGGGLKYKSLHKSALYLFVTKIYVAPLQVYYSEVIPTYSTTIANSLRPIGYRMHHKFYSLKQSHRHY